MVEPKRINYMSLGSDNNSTPSFGKKRNDTNIVNIIIESIFFVFILLGMFHMKSFIGLEPDILKGDEGFVLRFVIIFGVIFLLRFPIYFMLRLKGYVPFAFLGIALTIYHTVINTRYVYEQLIYKTNYTYLGATAAYLVLMVAYVYSEVYFAYYDNGLYRTKYDVFLKPDYKFKIWHRLYNGLYIVFIFYCILSMTYVINLDEYFISVIYIIVNVCIANTFTEKVIVSTGHRGNIMVLCVQFVFFVLGIILVYLHFKTQNTMQLFIGIIYILSLFETLFLCRYKVVK